MTPAVAVDHIVPKSQGGTDHPNNCQAICHRCHVLKTAQESHQGREGA
ncbi:HNH endonuclease [Xanthomonas albilineans]